MRLSACGRASHYFTLDTYALDTLAADLETERAGTTRVTDRTTGGRDENVSGARSIGTGRRADAAGGGAVARGHGGGAGTDGAGRRRPGRARHGRPRDGEREGTRRMAAARWPRHAPRGPVGRLHGAPPSEGAGALPAAGERAPAAWHGCRAGGRSAAGERQARPPRPHGHAENLSGG